MEATPMSELSVSPLALEIGQRVCVVRGSLMGLIGSLHSIENETLTIRLPYPKSGVFLRVPAKLVAADYNEG
jgi:hypothetical protein